MKKAIYAGSFNPLHQGHISIIKKSLKIFDSIIVVVANNPEKDNGENLDQRFLETKEKLSTYKNVIVKKMEKGLIADFAKKENIKILIRSSRNVEDFEFELMMGIKNKELNSELETILILPDEANIKIRSSIMPKK